MTSPPLNNHPFRAACPEATVITVGVARPSAQGQAITSTAETSLGLALQLAIAVLEMMTSQKTLTRYVEHLRP